MAQLLHARPGWAGVVLCLALSTGCAHEPPPGTSGARSSPAATSPAAEATSPPSAAPARTAPAVPPAAAGVAAGFITTLNTHDARRGHDAGLHDANVRTRPYDDDEVYAEIADPQTRTGSSLWQQLTAAGAVTAVHIDKIAVPEGAPAPTDAQAEVRVTYTVTTTGRGLHDAASESQAMQLAATPAGWRVDQLLAF